MRRSIAKIGIFIKKQTKLVVGLAVGIFIGTSAIAFAAIPNANGLITGCYQTGGLFANGQLRLINTPSQSCSGNETAINWNKATPGQFVDNLAGADFSSAQLQYRDFTNTNLTNVNLTSANTSHSIFKSANLTNATFDETVLNETDFSNANLREVNS